MRCCAMPVCCRHPNAYRADDVRSGGRLFCNEGYQTHEGGLIETKRGTTDATYLYYTLGKLQILKLRADLEKKEGAQFSLQQFHDDFLKQGFPPIKIVRRALLGDASPTL
jgi:hypothetical protein